MELQVPGIPRHHVYSIQNAAKKKPCILQLDGIWKVHTFQTFSKLCRHQLTKCCVICEKLKKHENDKRTQTA